MSRYDNPRFATPTDVQDWRELHHFPLTSDVDPLDVEDDRETDSQFKARIRRETGKAQDQGDVVTLEQLDVELLAYEGRTCGVCVGRYPLTAFWIPDMCRTHLEERRGA